MLRINSNALLIERAKKCLTSEELALKAGVGRNTIARIENNRVKVSSPVIIGKLAKALDIPIESLIIDGNKKVKEEV